MSALRTMGWDRGLRLVEVEVDGSGLWGEASPIPYWQSLLGMLATSSPYVLPLIFAFRQAGFPYSSLVRGAYRFTLHRKFLLHSIGGLLRSAFGDVLQWRGDPLGGWLQRVIRRRLSFFFCLSNRLALRFSSSGFGYYCIFFYFFSIFQLCCNYFFYMKVFYNFFNWIQPTSPPPPPSPLTTSMSAVVLISTHKQRRSTWIHIFLFLSLIFLPMTSWLNWKGPMYFLVWVRLIT